MANRSGGREQRNFRAFRFDRFGDCLGKSFFEHFGIHIVADKRKEIRREAADDFFLCQFLESFNRKNYIQIFFRADSWIF